jgi:hypothetical protein
MGGASAARRATSAPNSGGGGFRFLGVASSKKQVSTFGDDEVKIPHSTQPRAPAVNRLDAAPPAVGADSLPAWSGAKTMAWGIFHLAAPV